MKKLNNKGITTIEVLICFVLVVTITVSIYATVSSFNERKTLEGQREKIVSYKNLLTKEIQDDFVKIGLTNARYEKTYETVYKNPVCDSNPSAEGCDISSNRIVHTVYCTLKDGTERKLVIKQFYAKSASHLGGSTFKDDEFSIQYGTPDEMIDWDLPDLGHSGYDTETGAACTYETADLANCRRVLDLSINNVYINVYNDNILSIYIGLYHPEFTTRYAINVVAPINYISNGYDSSSNWKY